MQDISYIRLEFNTKKLELKKSVIRIYPLPCLHVGAPQSDAKFIQDHIARIAADPNARWVYMGDGGECVITASKGDIYSQILNPQQQVDLLVHLLKPIKNKGLFGIRGNHGNRIYKQTGLSFDKTVCLQLGIPYMGVNCFANIIVNRSSYDAYFHHGVDSGVSITSKINKAEAFTKFIDVDAFFTAHSHVCIDIPPSHILTCDNHVKQVKIKLRHQYICGCGYDSRTGYASEKGYPPLLPAFLSVEFSGSINTGKIQRQQSSQIFRSDGQHAVSGVYSWMPPLEVSI